MHYDQDKSLISKITWLYYINDYTQQQIAEIMHISRTKVTRYLQKAKQMGLVKISVDTDYRSCFEKEQQLQEKLGLKDVVICPAAATADDTLNNVGLAGAAHLKNMLTADDRLGVAWGRGIYHLAIHLNPVKPVGDKRIEVIQLMGGLGQSGRNNPEEIVKEIARRLGASGTWLNAPAIVSSLETRDLLQSDDGVRAVFDKASRCTKCLLGLGDVDESASLRITGFLSAEALAELKAKGAVGDILGRFFDVNGDSVHSSISDRTMSVPIEVIKQVPERIAFVTGLYKTEAIVGASRGGIINALVTDEDTADRVLQYLDQYRA